ncbi:MAG: molybdopterin molybdotransferase MoeA [Myxococcales bacterium]|nr:molybdopterin molybdotransferase MoeA [Myxococcales bacterium]
MSALTAAPQRPQPKATRGLPPLVPITDALTIIAAHVGPHGRTERVQLAEGAGRILATSAYADLDQPAFERSMMDGIAVRSQDCQSDKPTLVGAGASPAGTPYTGEVAPGTFVRVMTGGVVPPGADSVVPVERIRRIDGDPADPASGTWQLESAVRPGQHVANTGSEVASGDLVVAAGQRLGGARLGALASFGHAELEVAAKPRIAIIPTGTEIVDVRQVPQLGQVRNSNAYALAALFNRFGGECDVAPVVVDEAGVLTGVLRDAADKYDLVVTCGGVSMGDYDLVVGALAGLGAEKHFHRVKMKPGKPVLFATLNGTPILGLPGNPVSSTIGALVFGRTATALLMGAQRTGWVGLQAPVAGPMSKTGPREELRPGVWAAYQGRAAVAPVAMAGSADLAHFAGGDVLIHRPAHADAIDGGDTVELWLWPEAP